MIMNIRNRESDVNKLRTNICQDFLKMVIIDNWKDELYKKCCDEIKGKYKDKYQNAYQEMRDNGVEKYSIDKMDVSFIGTVINYCPNIAHVSSKAKNAFKDLVLDRNDKGHSHENEEDAELYLRAMVHLYDLKHFVRAVDNNEQSINDEIRGDFRKKYIKKIDELMDIIDEERINLVQKKKQIDKDIEYINSSEGEERERRKGVLSERYFNDWLEQIRLNNAKLKENGWVKPEDMEEPQNDYHLLMVEASNKGYTWAHLDAAEYYYLKNSHEYDNRVLLFLNSVDEIDKNAAVGLVDILNRISELNNLHGSKYDFSKTKQTILDRLKEEGYRIEKYEDGRYTLYNNIIHQTLLDNEKKL